MSGKAEFEQKNTKTAVLNSNELLKEEKSLFLPELINLMGPLLSGTLFPYNNSMEQAHANLLFNSIKEESKKLLKCFSNAPLYHVNNFLINSRQDLPQIYLDNKQFVLAFNNRDDPQSWFCLNDELNGSTQKRILISDLIKEIEEDENHWLGDILHSESRRIQSRVQKCKVRYGAVLNFFVSNSSAIPILIQSNKQKKMSSIKWQDNTYQCNYHYNQKNT